MIDSSSLMVYNDDARQQVWPFLRYVDSSLFQGDFLADYQLAMNPVGFSATYRLSAFLVDPRWLSKVLPYALLAAMCGSVGWTAWRLGGAVTCWTSLALCLSADTYLTQMAGGLPRAFGYPVVAFATAALVKGSPFGLATAAALGAAFYYPVGVFGVALVGFFCLLPPAFSGCSALWSLKRRALFFTATATLCSLLMLPSLYSMSPYGPVIGPKNWNAFPEASPGGRLTGTDVVARAPVSSLAASADEWLMKGVGPIDTAWLSPAASSWRRYPSGILLLAFSMLVIAHKGFARDRGAELRLLLLPVSTIAVFCAAWALVPHLYVPQRYIKFGLPLTTAVLLPIAVIRCATWMRLSVRGRRVAGAMAAVALIAVSGGRGPTSAGLTVRLPADAEPLRAFIAQLPPTSLIAGWPSTPEGWPQTEISINDVPYLTARKVLLTQEVHLPFHQAYVSELRRRMVALTAAYFASDTRAITDLRDQFGVTHLLVDLRHYREPFPTYFRPFADDVDAAITAMKNGPEVVRQLAIARVFTHGHHAVVDLSRIASAIPD